MLELAVSVGPNAPIAARHDDAEDDADEPAEDALGERLADHLAHDEPLRPTERLERPELAHALADRRERQEDGEQERGDRREHGERRSEPLREARRVDERAADRVGDLLRARDLRPRVERLDLLLHIADRCPVLGADEEDVDGALLAREHLELRQRRCRRRPSGRQRRPHEADHREVGAVEVELRADLQALPARVGARERAPRGRRALARGDEPAARDERCGDDADSGRRRVNARDRVRGALDVRLRRIDDLLQRLLGRRDRGAEALQPRGQALSERAPVAGAARAAATTEATAALPPAGRADLPPPLRAADRDAGLLRDTSASAANSAAVGGGICRLTRICWPPALIFATIFGTVPDWCTAASTRPLETDATPSTFAIWAAVVCGNVSCVPGRKKSWTNLSPGLPSFERSVITD